MVLPKLPDECIPNSDFSLEHYIPLCVRGLSKKIHKGQKDYYLVCIRFGKIYYVQFYDKWMSPRLLNDNLSVLEEGAYYNREDAIAETERFFKIGLKRKYWWEGLKRVADLTLDHDSAVELGYNICEYVDRAPLLFK